jgi:hypothetical protein
LVGLSAAVVPGCHAVARAVAVGIVVDLHVKAEQQPDARLNRIQRGGDIAYASTIAL